MQIDIQHDPGASRFHAPIHDPEDGEGPVEMAEMGMVLSYRQVARDVVDFRSTLVPAHLRGRGLGEVLLYTEEDNTAAVTLYERTGFRRFAVDVSWRK